MLNHSKYRSQGGWTRGVGQDNIYTGIGMPILISVKLVIESQSQHNSFRQRLHQRGPFPTKKVQDGVLRDTNCQALSVLRNPYQNIPGLYGAETMRQYKRLAAKAPSQAPGSSCSISMGLPLSQVHLCCNLSKQYLRTIILLRLS